jgi:FkbM family methyltransferase
MGIILKMCQHVPTSWIQWAGRVRGKAPWIKRWTDWLPNLLRNQKGRIQKGLGTGLWFDGAGSAVGFALGTHDPDVQVAFARLLRPGMTVYDIGANVGFTAILAARQVEASGQVICFEPLEVNAAQIILNANMNRFVWVVVRREALGVADGEAEFHVSQSPTWGRLADAGQTPLHNAVVRVPIRSLDSLISKDKLPSPHFIKMDVEGAEADVLKGGRSILAQARPVMVIELHNTNQAVIDALAGLDYTVRILGSGGDVLTTPGEFQVLAYPRERSDIDALWFRTLSEKIVLP